jgi:hypothetical protein
MKTGTKAREFDRTHYRFACFPEATAKSCQLALEKWPCDTTGANEVAIVLCVYCVLAGVYCGAPHGQKSTTNANKYHDFSLDTGGGALAGPPCTQAVLMANVGWVVDILAKLSMRPTAIHAN